MKYFKLFLISILAFVLVSCNGDQNFTVMFETNRGSPVSSREIKANQKIVNWEEPEREGYNFLGWFEDKTFNTKWDFEKDVITKNTTLYANWEKTIYNIDFDVDGGSEIAALKVEHNELVTKPQEPEKEGFYFVDWYKDVELEHKWDFLANKITEDTTLYAKWSEKELIIIFNKQDGSPSEEVYLNYNDLVEQPEAPTRAGYVFGGWYKTVSYDDEWNFSEDKVREETILYAKWNPVLFTVSFLGVDDVEDLDVGYGQLVIEPETPEKEGQIFQGWFRDQNGTHSWDFTIDKIYFDTTIYAVWKKDREPLISGHKNMTIRQGELNLASLMKNVVAEDEIDGDITDNIEVDYGELEDQVGEYEIIYYVTNSVGASSYETITLTIEQATKELPYLDNRDFEVQLKDTNNDLVVTADFSYDEIDFQFSNYDAHGHNGRMQVLTVLKRQIKSNTTYVLSFVAQASKEIQLQPYMQSYPAHSPWTNVLNSSFSAVGDDKRIIQHQFTIGEAELEYVFSIEYGNAFRNGESGWLKFSDIKLIEQEDAKKVTFHQNNNQDNIVQYVEETGLAFGFVPQNENLKFEGWYADEELKLRWDFAENQIIEDTNLYAKWETREEPLILGAKDLTLNLSELAEYDYKSGITVYDAVDGDLIAELEVDLSAVEAEVGVYEIIYSVVNSRGISATETILLTVREDYKEYPYMDNRDFREKYQHLKGTTIEATFNYDEIIYEVTDYNYDVVDQHGNLQIERTIDDYITIKPNTTYKFSFEIKATNEGIIKPYLQKIPIKSPYTNLFGEGSISEREVGTEYSRVELTFTTPNQVEANYSLSVEFGMLIKKGSSGKVYFRNFEFEEVNN
jgi:uncharacterized repeat protein (TIGR02543 family)